MQTQIWLLVIFVFAYLANHGWPWWWKWWWIPKSPIKVPSIVKCQIFTLQICSGWWGVPRGCRVPHCTHLCYRFWRHFHSKSWWISILSSRGEQIFIWIIHWHPVFQHTRFKNRFLILRIDAKPASICFLVSQRTDGQLRHRARSSGQMHNSYLSILVLPNHVKPCKKYTKKFVNSRQMR